MQLKDKEYLINVVNRVSASVTTVNETITAYKNGKMPLENFQATITVQQLVIQHDILIALAMLVFDPGTDTSPLPEMPKKIIGFN